MKLVIATRNKHKLQEIREILGDVHLEIVSAFDFPHIPDVEEDGITFEENAVKKAVTLARATGCWSLADDSGLEVDALGGAPGVYSARYAGEPPDYSANNRKLLQELADKPDRKARFRCVMALSSPAGETRTVSGSCEGSIIHALQGEQGFGYDPLFVPEGFQKSFAEMGASEKHTLSHRGHALTKAKASWLPMLATEPSNWTQPGSATPATEERKKGEKHL